MSNADFSQWKFPKNDPGKVLGWENTTGKYLENKSVQAESALLTAIAALTPTDGNVIVGNGTSWVAESGTTAYASLGVIPDASLPAKLKQSSLPADANDITETGWYKLSSGASNVPVAQSALLMHQAYDTDNAVQIWSSLSITGGIYIRRKNTGVWIAWRKLANVTDANTWAGAQTFDGAVIQTFETLTDGATITPDLSDCNLFKVTLGGNRTLANPTNITAGQAFEVYVTQDGTGSRTLAYGTYFEWPGGTAPVLSTAAGALDVLFFRCVSTTQIIGNIVQDFS